MTALESEMRLHYCLGLQLARFGQHVDQRATSRLADVFTEDFTGVYGGIEQHRTLAQFIVVLEHALGHGSNCGASQHNVLNLQLLEYSDSHALTRCNFYAAHQGLNRFAGQIWQSWGEYRDTWRAEEGGWRICHRQYTTLFEQGPAEINSRD